MNSLEMMMGLNPQGVPNSFPMQGVDPMYAMAMQGDSQGMMEQLGMPSQQDPYEILGMDAPMGMDEGARLAQEMLGGQYPELTQEDINTLALGIGIDNGSSEFGTNPAFLAKFDMTRYMTGGM